MRVLVVGGAGYIGGAVTDALLKRQINFTVYDGLLYEPHYLKPVDFVRGDVRNYEFLADVMQGYTHIIWLAAIVGDGACEINRNLTKFINQDAVEWVARNFKGRIAFTSTCSVYGEHEGEVAEDGMTNPLSWYATTKLAAEKFLLERDNSLVFRLGTAFGLSDTYSRPRMDLVANQMPVAALTTGSVTLFGGEQWRPMIHVKDIANALVNNLDLPVRGLYNLATANVQIKELAIKCAEITDCNIVVKSGGSDARDYRADTTKALRDHIFNPYEARTIADGIQEFADLVQSNRIKSVENSLYFNVKHLGGLNDHGQYA